MTTLLPPSPEGGFLSRFSFGPQAFPALRAPNGAQSLSAPPKATSFARGPACGGRAAPLPSAFPQCFPLPLLSLPLPLHSLKPPLLPRPFLLPPAGRKTPPKSQNTRPSPAPPRPLRGRQTERSPFRLRRKPRASLVGPPAAGGLRPCPLPSPNVFPVRCFRSLSPCTHSNPRSYQAPFSPSPADPKNSPAAFHRLRGSVHLWYFVPALMAQARYSCSHSSTRAS